MKKKVVSGKRKRKKTKPTRLVLLLFFVISNTFAWFIYATRVDNDVSVHVRAWNVIFESGDHEISNLVNLNVDNIYPGMEDYEYEIKAYNRSEVNASLSYKILEARIFDNLYITVDGRAERNEEVLPGDFTSDLLESRLLNDYPFKISIDISNNFIDPETGEEEYTFKVVWPYESNNDALDTEWGINAATYKKNNPSNSSIALKIKIIITQLPN